MLDHPSLQRSKWFKSSAGLDVLPQRKEKLGQWLATGICGNDITSSCLYVAAIATTYAGALSPVVLLMVEGLLYLYRGIYAEVGDALPLNGGAYNALLNTTTKFKASLAACMTILSYMATAVISASTAVAYAKTLIPGLSHIPTTIGVLGVFAILTIIGITESAKVALTIFILQMLDDMYPVERIELIQRQNEFGPELIESLSKEFGIPKNYMFIGAPSSKFPHRISDLGGVRLIL